MQPLRGSVHGRGQPGGPGADHDQIVERLGRLRSQARLLGHFGQARLDENGAIGKEDDREAVRLPVRLLDEGPGFRIPLYVQEPIGYLAARQEVLDRVTPGRPQRSGHPDARVRYRGRGFPIADQVVQDRIQVLLGGRPRLHQVVIQPDGVDRGDRGLGVGVRREKDLTGLRVQAAGLGQKLGTAHVGHALVHEEERDRVVPLLQPVGRLQRLGPGTRLHDPVLLAEVALEVALDGVEYLRFVVHGEDDGSGHFRFVPWKGA